MKKSTGLSTAFRIAAWLAVVIVVVLSIIPASIRPVSVFPSEVEHFGIFFLAGCLNYLGYPRRLRTSLMIALIFAGVIELLQIPLPDRHARLTDFVIDAAAAGAGTVLGFFLACFGSAGSWGSRAKLIQQETRLDPSSPQRSTKPSL